MAVESASVSRAITTLLRVAGSTPCALRKNSIVSVENGIGAACLG